MKPQTARSKHEDRRVTRTRVALLDSLLALIVEKGYDETTVQDVLDRAGVGRATFYTHYFNKRDLLLRHMSLFRLDVSDPTQMPDVTRIFAHVAENAQLYPGLRDTDGLNGFLAVARADLLESFETLFRTRFGDTDPGRVQFLARFFTGALLDLMVTWLDEGTPISAEEMNRCFRELGNRVLSG